MKNKWYRDDRDLVKCGTLIHLSNAYGLEDIIQVASLTDDHTQPELETDDGPAPISNEVWSHSRDMRNIRNLLKRTNTKIIVINEPFDHSSRDKYIKHVLAVMTKYDGNNKIMFLDPNLGITPTRATAAHVKRDEIRTLWEQHEAKRLDGVLPVCTTRAKLD
ncbi:MAG: hypothetical protein JRJ03_14425 [Deltaproteobacteria bacterium]|nr:hypothetical protein [Deltaproteobacteria bacterium]